LPQADGKIKNRPALILREMPDFGDFLVCEISTQARQAIQGFDEIITVKNTDFVDSGLLVNSIVRLGFLAVLPRISIAGAIGRIAPERHCRLLRRLSEHLATGIKAS